MSDPYDPDIAETEFDPPRRRRRRTYQRTNRVTSAYAIAAAAETMIRRLGRYRFQVQSSNRKDWYNIEIAHRGQRHPSCDCLDDQLCKHIMACEIVVHGEPQPLWTPKVTLTGALTQARQLLDEQQQLLETRLGDDRRLRGLARKRKAVDRLLEELSERHRALILACRINDRHLAGTSMEREICGMALDGASVREIRSVMGWNPEPDEDD